MLPGARGMRRFVFLERGELVRIGKCVGFERVRFERFGAGVVSKRIGKRSFCLRFSGKCVGKRIFGSVRSGRPRAQGGS